MRMTSGIFDWILSFVAPHIEKQDTNYRKSIPAAERLALTLRFLATGETFRSLSFAFRIGRQTVEKIIPETCKAIWYCFAKEYVPFPNSPGEWLRVAKDYEEKWQFPHCCGSIDGKHILRECPKNSGSLYYNYKGTYSSVLMAIADANYRFIMIDYGHYGSESDGGIFRKTNVGKRILNGSLNLPQPKELPNSDVNFQYYFIGDEAFPLSFNLLRPYPRMQLQYKERIYNYRLSRARRIIENAFGILAARFRVFRRPLNYSDDTTQCIVLAACVLHNILVEQSSAYCSSEFVDVEDENYVVSPGQWRNIPQGSLRNVCKSGSNMYTREAKTSRYELKEYLATVGAVEWQDRMINPRN